MYGHKYQKYLWTSLSCKAYSQFFLQCSLETKKLDGRRLFKVKKSHWLFAVSMLTGPVPLIRY